ncbi:MAG: carbamoyltransferase HypF [Fimbriimonadaceae bacterium]|nr:carbamoyltransferase HypF [Fimbriimonadaceae bacterium]
MDPTVYYFDYAILAGMTSGPRSRRELRLRGLVQGVGCRPFVYRLARACGVSGEVRNDGQGAVIEAEGSPAELAHFQARLLAEFPPPGQIAELVVRELPVQGDAEFLIAASADRGRELAWVLPDLATCPACCAEVADPADRRAGYAFTNCTHCGPRFSIITAVPYDRPRTTMAGFPLCAACAAEYHDPGDRRFHAQPVACPVCGPQLRLLSGTGEPLPGAPLATAAELLRSDAVLAVKGLGGYHLACRARSSAAVATLRERKLREARPLAVMVADLAAARAVATVSPAAATLLASPAAPIVLLPQGAAYDLAPEVAPGLRRVGLLLPYTPLHHLLLAAVGEPLVLTSGNLSDEPMAYADDEALARLGPLVEAVLTHDRRIARRCDDSVAVAWSGGLLPLRRSRGYAPEPVRLSQRRPATVLAVGAHQKNTFCLLHDGEAFLSPHVGDLESEPALASFEAGIADYEQLFGLRPAVLAHDLHPDYLATRYAVQRAAAAGLPTIAVQHHHAHVAACLADHDRADAVLGVTFDGTGLGPDGSIWGGEVLLADCRGYRRLAHLRPFVLPGGEAAVRQGWRIALALAQQVGLPLPEAWWPDAARAAFVRQMIARQVQCPATSSAGRLFDAFSALLGCRPTSRYEGEAAVALEGQADPAEAGRLPFGLLPGEVRQIDWEPALRAAVEQRLAGVAAPVLAMRFHRGLAQTTADLCRQLADATGVATVALSGGCFQNLLLLELLASQLQSKGLEVLVHRRVPPNDGGLSLGQAVVAAALGNH